jgi:hypothetical protein
MDEQRVDWRHVATYAVVAFAIVAFFSMGTGFLRARTHHDAAVQPIAFNHEKHVKENQLDCSTCHQFYETETFSGFPEAETCATCHQQPLGKSAEEARLVQLLKENKPLVWGRLFRQPPHIFYSHRRHVVKAKLKCEQCHGAIALATSPPRVVKKLSMNDCIDCHKRNRVSVDCTTCHR